MEILGIEKLSLVDYEGQICATIFTGGCNYRCPFCHNSGLVYKQEQTISEREIFDYLEARRGLLDAVTISGGEPTLQNELERFIVKIRDLGYKIKLDTNGTMPEVLENLLDKNLLDYVAMDIKNSFDRYQPITGVKNALTERIKQSLRLLGEHKVKYELRTTLVAGFHTKESIEELSKDLNGQPMLYLQKFVDSGRCIDQGLHSISEDVAKEYQNILKKTIKEVHLRGY